MEMDDMNGMQGHMDDMDGMDGYGDESGQMVSLESSFRNRQNVTLTTECCSV